MINFSRLSFMFYNFFHQFESWTHKNVKIQKSSNTQAKQQLL